MTQNLSEKNEAVKSDVSPYFVLSLFIVLVGVGFAFFSLEQTLYYVDDNLHSAVEKRKAADPGWTCQIPIPFPFPRKSIPYEEAKKQEQIALKSAFSSHPGYVVGFGVFGILLGIFMCYLFYMHIESMVKEEEQKKLEEQKVKLESAKFCRERDANLAMERGRERKDAIENFAADRKFRGG